MWFVINCHMDLQISEVLLTQNWFQCTENRIWWYNIPCIILLKLCFVWKGCNIYEFQGSFPMCFQGLKKPSVFTMRNFLVILAIKIRAVGCDSPLGFHLTKAWSQQALSKISNPAASSKDYKKDTPKIYIKSLSERNTSNCFPFPVVSQPQNQNDLHRKLQKSWRL